MGTTFFFIFVSTGEMLFDSITELSTGLTHILFVTVGAGKHTNNTYSIYHKHRGKLSTYHNCNKQWMNFLECIHTRKKWYKWVHKVMIKRFSVFTIIFLWSPLSGIFSVQSYKLISTSEWHAKHLLLVNQHLFPGPIVIN